MNDELSLYIDDDRAVPPGFTHFAGYRVHSANKIGRLWLERAIADDLSRDDGPRSPVGWSFGPIEPRTTRS